MKELKEFSVQRFISSPLASFLFFLLVMSPLYGQGVPDTERSDTPLFEPDVLPRDGNFPSPDLQENRDEIPLLAPEDIQIPRPTIDPLEREQDRLAQTEENREGALPEVSGQQRGVVDPTGTQSVEARRTLPPESFLGGNDQTGLDSSVQEEIERGGDQRVSPVAPEFAGARRGSNTPPDAVGSSGQGQYQFDQIREDVPRISGLKVESDASKVRLTWLPFRTDAGIPVTYRVYRSPTIMNDSTSNLFDFVGFKSDGTTFFEDSPPTPGEYYYAVFVEIDNKENVVYTAENTLTAPVSFDGIFRNNIYEQYGVTDWAQIKSQEDSRESSREVMGSGEPPASSPVSVVTEGSAVQPIVNVYLAAPAQSLPPAPVAPPSEDLDERARRLAEARRLKRLYPEVLFEVFLNEKQSPNNEYEHELQWILYKLLTSYDWQKAQDDLLILLQKSRKYSRDLRDRISFYRGQIYYIFGDYPRSLLEFKSLVENSIYKADAVRWLDKVDARGY